VEKARDEYAEGDCRSDGEDARKEYEEYEEECGDNYGDRHREVVLAYVLRKFNQVSTL
jgi:hypothetical protein